MGWGSQKYFIYLFSPTVAKLIYNKYATSIYISFYLVQPAGIFYTLVNVHFWSFAHLTT